jgi:hypothetical protein
LLRLHRPQFLPEKLDAFGVPLLLEASVNRTMKAERPPISIGTAAACTTRAQKRAESARRRPNPNRGLTGPWVRAALQQRDTGRAGSGTTNAIELGEVPLHDRLGAASTSASAVQQPRSPRALHEDCAGVCGFAIRSHIMSKHTIVWLDQQEARVFHVHPATFDETAVHAPARHVHRHAKGASEARQHPEDPKHFFDDVAKALEDAQEILLVGPGTAKLHFLRHAHKYQPDLEAKILGIETVDHPTDKQLVAYARRYFVAADRVH